MSMVYVDIDDIDFFEHEDFSDLTPLASQNAPPQQFKISDELETALVVPVSPKYYTEGMSSNSIFDTCTYGRYYRTLISQLPTTNAATDSRISSRRLGLCEFNPIAFTTSDAI